jgi:hypothetical protein
MMDVMHVLHGLNVLLDQECKGEIRWIHIMCKYAFKVNVPMHTCLSIAEVS